MKKTTVRPIRIEGDIAYVTLSKGYEAIIDAADVPKVEDRNWCAQEGSSRTVYAVHTLYVGGRYKRIQMHRLINETPEGFCTDHIDGNGLNNRKCNLRTATVSENGRNQALSSANSSGVKGVSFERDISKWRARIRHQKRLYNLGFFKCRTAAAIAYAKASAELHGSFGRVT